MPEPRWHDVDLKTGACAHCGGTHYGSGFECPYREENMGEPCVVCGERTNYCCSDCGIDSGGKEKVYVCVTEACRVEHEKKHPDMLRGHCEATDPEHTAMVRDARRYRRLQILGCQVASNDGMSSLLRFTNLDKALDDDLRINPSRGEASPLPPL